MNQNHMTPLMVVIGIQSRSCLESMPTAMVRWYRSSLTTLTFLTIEYVDNNEQVVGNGKVNDKTDSLCLSRKAACLCVVWL